MATIIRKVSQQMGNNYYPIGDKGPQLGGNADQESEVAEEINDAMESQDQDNFFPGKDNMVVDKMESRDVDPGTILAELKQLAILTKGEYARKILNTTINKFMKIIGE